MNQVENICVVIAEECAEITQVISKCARFGFQNHHPDKPEETNEQHLYTEYYQLQAMIEELEERKIIHRPSQEKIAMIKSNKRQKVRYFYDCITAKLSEKR